ncbi:acyl-CoA dehydrogenase family protein [Antarctobacter sp.]|uniref:acyl-CoA dehydrogenase family protein n=1 Tax=Antarctobacter sp. TaxID=1872577 RepID=UPI003A8E8B64
MLDTRTDTEDQAIFRDTIRRMVADRIAPIAAEIDAQDKIPTEIVNLFGDMGLLQIYVPDAYGGPGGNLTMACIAKEEIARASFSASHLVGATSIALVLPLLHYGTQAQRDRYLPEIAKGRTVSAIAMTEPHTGSDVSGIRTSARKDGNSHYVVNGQKVFITNADIADYVLLFARTAEGDGHSGISSFIVPTDTPGFVRGAAAKKMGLNGIKSLEIYFEDMRIPADCLIGEEGRGFHNAMGVLNLNRPTVAAAAVGLAQGALDAALAYAKEREQFGRPIAEFQAIQMIIAEMAVQIEAARALLYKTCKIAETGDLAQLAPMASIAKTFASDVAMKVTTDAVQVLGGAGYLKDHPVERMMRDAKITQIYEGTNQIQRLIIMKALMEQ